jgi:DMSO/TMAO reductase YedYZ molybdopterin-dependent catalytic subunit
MNRLLISAIIVIVIAVVGIGTYIDVQTQNDVLDVVEIREYEGKDLSSINAFRENSIKGSQYVNENNYTLSIVDLDGQIYELAYDHIVSDFTSYKKVVSLLCVEGWSVTILWEGVRIMDILEKVGIDLDGEVMIFRAFDGYSTSLPLDYLIDNEILLAYKMNNITLPPERGFPFQLVAESKYGYKWIKWITMLEVSNDSDYLGFWESRGYSNEADIR